MRKLTAVAAMVIAASPAAGQPSGVFIEPDPTVRPDPTLNSQFPMRLRNANNSAVTVQYCQFFWNTGPQIPPDYPTEAQPEITPYVRLLARAGATGDAFFLGYAIRQQTGGSNYRWHLRWELAQANSVTCPLSGSPSPVPPRPNPNPNPSPNPNPTPNPAPGPTPSSGACLLVFPAESDARTGRHEFVENGRYYPANEAHRRAASIGSRAIVRNFRGRIVGNTGTYDVNDDQQEKSFCEGREFNQVSEPDWVCLVLWGTAADATAGRSDNARGGQYYPYTTAIRQYHEEILLYRIFNYNRQMVTGRTGRFFIGDNAAERRFCETEFIQRRSGTPRGSDRERTAG